MPRFDLDVWKARTAERLRKAIASGRGRAAARAFLHDVVACEELATLVEWCESQGIGVRFDNTPNGMCQGKVIAVNSRMRPENQLHVLLHECGHYLVNQHRPKSRFMHNGDVQRRGHKQTLLYKVDVLDEELEAWHRGLKLATRLNLRLDIDRYTQTRTRYIMTYTKWVAPARPARSRWRKRNGKAEGASGG